MLIREKHIDEKIPYDLLLLADEEIPAIDKYIHESVILYAMDGDKLAGCCAVRIKEEKESDASVKGAEIMNIAVYPEFRKAGIGRKLMQRASEYCQNSGCTWLDIGTATTSVIPLRLYRSEGFVDHHIRKNFFPENYSRPIIEDGVQCIDMIVLRKPLE